MLPIVQPRFGIVTPTLRRYRFLPMVFRQVRAQSYPHWIFVLVNDGPDPQARQIFEHHCGSDPKMHYLETPATARDWGATPRSVGVELFAQLPQPLDYLLFWDDDNAFYPDALRIVAEELRRFDTPDLLIISLANERSQTPRPDLHPYQAQISEVDTGNFVVCPQLAQAAYRACLTKRGGRGEDSRFYDAICSDGHSRIVVSPAPPIGRYDGLRFFVTLRWKLGIPRLGISEQRWYMPIRRWLRG